MIPLTWFDVRFGGFLQVPNFFVALRWCWLGSTAASLAIATARFLHAMRCTAPAKAGTRWPGTRCALTMWNATAGQNVYKFRPDQLLCTLGVAFSAAKTSVETIGGTDYLSTQFTFNRKVRVMDGNKAMLLPVKKDVTHTMTPHGLKDIPWLINSWNIISTTGLPTVDILGAVS